MMNGAPNTLRLGTGPDPIELVRHWPEQRSLASLISARGGSSLSRWSILAEPRRHRAWTGNDPHLVESLDELAAEQSLDPVDDPAVPPFRGGNLLLLRYELGRALEPSAGLGPIRNPTIPVAQSVECPTALAHDRETDCWWLVGDLTDPGNLRGLLQLKQCQPAPPSLEALEAGLSDEAYSSLVRKTVEYIEAGDLFQANISRRFTAAARVENRMQRRQLAAGLLRESGAWFGGVLEVPLEAGETTIISLSPELFLQLDPITRRVRSRPIKGTLPAGHDPDVLKHSDKDAAELAMIVDLMRNDLGRISERGSIRVETARTIEEHPGVIHGVGEVCGTLSAGVGMGALLKATFPPGSITGAPKIRAMQVIDEFEQSPRGPYCGAIGYSSRCGRLALDVSIRTVELIPETTAGVPGATHLLRYGSGCGIVAQSNPDSEALESSTKAALLASFIREQCSSITKEQRLGQLPESPDSRARACASS